MIVLIFGLATIFCLLAGILMIKKEPRRILNGFLIETGLVLLVLQIVIFFSERFGLADKKTAAPIYLFYFLILLLGIALIADGIWVVRKEGKSIPNMLPFVFGVLAIFVAYVGYRDLSSGISGSELYVKIMSVIYNIMLYVPYAIGAFLIYSIIYLHLPKNKDVDYLIVLGCGIRKNGDVTPLLRGRLDKAIRWYQKGGQKAKFVVSGGKGSDEVISEALAMKNYLLSQNIPEEKIILEDQSVNTKENLLFSKKRIDEDGCGSGILICTSNYHVLRAVILARSLSIDAQGIGGHTALYYLPVAFFREYIAVIFRYKLLILVYIAIAVVLGVAV